ncbi:MAG: dTDP-4-dehydrorhamnose reductase [Pirellulales bacterium]|nr:dTDP-4-dehydrorhamnose reductase [Pirellulales bacterium]
MFWHQEGQSQLMTGKIVIIGAGGQLGRQLLREFGERAAGLARADLELTKIKSIRENVRALRPTAVINSAAYTNVDRAEEESQLCRAVNTLAVGQIAAACEDVDCPFIHISTDYVFTTEPGKRLPWRETDRPLPLGEYAQSKWRGEHEAAKVERHMVIRTCGLYSAVAHTEARNFVNTISRFAQTGRPLRVVNDQFCTPSFVPHVATGVKFLVDAALTGNARWGTYHLTNRGAATWFELAEAIVELANLPVSVEPISTAEYAAPAPRPKYSVLDCGKYRELGGPQLPFWREAIEERMRGVEVA